MFSFDYVSVRSANTAWDVISLDLDRIQTQEPRVLSEFHGNFNPTYLFTLQQYISLDKAKSHIVTVIVTETNLHIYYSMAHNKCFKNLA